MKQVLLIDDDKDDAELFREALLDINSEMVFKHYQESNTGLKALLEESIDLPDLIFLDINMPILSGWECLTQFKRAQHLKNIPVFMFTTSSQPREREIAKELGASGFITKPSEYKALKDLLFDVLKNN